MRASLRFLLFALVLAPSAPAQQQSRAAIPEAEIRSLVQRWDRANAARDVRALSAIYASELRLYGETMSRETCLLMKRRYFADHAAYTQSIAGVIAVATNRFGLGYVATFEKRVRVAVGERTYASYLVVDDLPGPNDTDDKGWRVIIESDTTTDGNLLRLKRTYDPAKFKSRKDVAMAIFKSAPAIRDAIDASSIIEFEAFKIGAHDYYRLHLYHFGPFDIMTRTDGWYTLDARSGTLLDVFDKKLRYDRRLLARFADFDK